ncbi:hypothetical protein [Microbacterium pygmaeum]|uniref:Uncharacterized protein n=1 Tax=Microbacterium pygmaeum TaxID=370764 RepID=A0A1G7YG43_9MICO|nr:hypothetical protein [Microbacterium pygmaeum]SDG95255.1 hypothetical protein SAMN04489810_1739 [Microbacterium pygmaeum]
MEIAPGDHILYMKVGVHAGETLEDILERKRREVQEAGFAMWGYGGNSCFPTRVREFAERVEGPITLVMQEINSNHNAAQVRSREYSTDRETWREIPAEVNVLGSKYALVLSSLDDVDTLLDLSATRVGVGDSRGKVGKDYIRGRLDKACLDVVDAPTEDAATVKISVAAPLMAPYAVFLRD